MGVALAMSANTPGSRAARDAGSPSGLKWTKYVPAMPWLGASTDTPPTWPAARGSMTLSRMTTSTSPPAVSELMVRVKGLVRSSRRRPVRLRSTLPVPADAVRMAGRSAPVARSTLSTNSALSRLARVPTLPDASTSRDSVRTKSDGPAESTSPRTFTIRVVPMGFSMGAARRRSDGRCVPSSFSTSTSVGLTVWVTLKSNELSRLAVSTWTRGAEPRLMTSMPLRTRSLADRLMMRTWS